MYPFGRTTLPAVGGITDKKLSSKPSTRREVAFCINVAKWWYRGPKQFVRLAKKSNLF